MTSQNSEAAEALDLTRFDPCLLSVSYPAAPQLAFGRREHQK